MFRNNPDLRSAGERIEMTPELQKEWFKCAQDPIHFLETYYYIITLDEGKQLFKLREYQKKIIKLLVQPPIHLPHLICNIPRQCGKCVSGNTKIKIRNKKTKKIEEITIKEFYDRFNKV